ncbi:unnamed protein product, partial [Ixodes pacificus]
FCHLEASTRYNLALSKYPRAVDIAEPAEPQSRQSCLECATAGQHDESGGSGSGYDNISEDEDVNRSLVAMVGEKRFGLEPYLYDPSASSSATDEESSDSPEMPGSPHPPAARRVGTANWCSCGSICRPMQTVEESVCCMELHIVVRMCSDQGVPSRTKNSSM